MYHSPMEWMFGSEDFSGTLWLAITLLSRFVRGADREERDGQTDRQTDRQTELESERNGRSQYPSILRVSSVVFSDQRSRKRFAAKLISPTIAL